MKVDIHVNYGQTVNRGNYETERVDASITIKDLECKTSKEMLEKEQALFDRVKAQVERHTDHKFR